MLAQTPKTITRSRNGCAICKSKRLKCDEAKPSCSRCKRLGIPCPGYKRALKWAKTGDGCREAATISRDTEFNGNSASTIVPNSDDLDFSAWTINPEQLQSHWSNDYTDIDIDDSEPPAQAASTSNSSDSLQLDPGNSLPFYAFDELSADANLQLEQTLETRTSPFDQGLEGDGLWPILLPNQVEPAVDIQACSESSNQASIPAISVPITKSLNDNTSILVEYYFKEVCGMMSCYDSTMNPYRTTISKTWSGSPSLYYIIQSMSAACLSGVSRSFSSLGHRLRDQAAICMSREAQASQVETSALLSLVMYGMSLSWHEPSNVGLTEFETLNKLLLLPRGRRSVDNVLNRQQKFFFYNSLVYWRMLLAFVTDQEPNIEGIWHSQQHHPDVQGHHLYEPQMPHPQTGIGIEVQKLVAKVGHVVRKERKRMHSRRPAWRHDAGEAERALLDAKQIYSELCTIELPWENLIMNSGDESTPADHLLKVAEAYRCTGILQLYRTFPDLLPYSATLQDATEHTISSTSADDQSASANMDCTRDTWLLCLALHILDLVQDIPLSSKSRSIQPLLLVSVCSELAVGRNSGSWTNMQRCPVASIADSPRFKTAPSDLEVLRARQLLISRLSSFENVLAAKPIRQMLLLVHETWAWMDESHEEVHWIDVMMEKGYETLMG